jgi:hypothetical protein
MRKFLGLLGTVALLLVTLVMLAFVGAVIYVAVVTPPLLVSLFSLGIQTDGKRSSVRNRERRESASLGGDR